MEGIVSMVNYRTTQRSPINTTSTKNAKKTMTISHNYVVYSVLSIRAFVICCELKTFLNNKRTKTASSPPYVDTKDVQMCFYLKTNQNRSVLYRRHRRFHCPSSEAIWLPAPSRSNLNTSRWKGPRIVLLK